MLILVLEGALLERDQVLCACAVVVVLAAVWGFFVVIFIREGFVCLMFFPLFSSWYYLLDVFFLVCLYYLYFTFRILRRKKTRTRSNRGAHPDAASGFRQISS